MTIKAALLVLLAFTTYVTAQRYQDVALNIDFQTFELDGHVHDILWCGSSDETILVQTDDGTVYRSRDRGANWKRLKSLMQKQGQSVADADQDVSSSSSNAWQDRQGAQDCAEPSGRPADRLPW